MGPLAASLGLRPNFFENQLPIEFFFEGAPQIDGAAVSGFSEPEGAAFVSEFMGSSEGLQLMQSFLKIGDPRVRRRIVDLVAALGENATPNGQH